VAYLLSSNDAERERLQLQAKVWEPAGARLLAEIPAAGRRRAVDVGCGCYGWLPLLGRWMGEGGGVVGTDVDPAMLAMAATSAEKEGWGDVELVQDDLFASRLEPATFDLVHARFQLTPLGRFEEQLAAYERLLRPGGLLVLEDTHSRSWSFFPAAPALEQLVQWIAAAFRAAGGDLDAGLRHRELLVPRGWRVWHRADVVALPPTHPYLRLPVQFAASLRPRLVAAVDEAALDDCLAAAEDELADPARWGLTFTLVQTVATRG
jgi:SAM-dependent methyltransferase